MAFIYILQIIISIFMVVVASWNLKYRKMPEAIKVFHILVATPLYAYLGIYAVVRLIKLL